MVHFYDPPWVDYDGVQTDQDLRASRFEIQGLLDAYFAAGGKIARYKRYSHGPEYWPPEQQAESNPLPASPETPANANS